MSSRGRTIGHRTIVALCAAMAPVLMAVLPVWGAPPSSCTPAPSSLPGSIPADAVACGSPTPQTNAFAALAWQAFKMIVWPAAQSPAGIPLRGDPDLQRSLSDLRGPRVFETFKADWETFLRSAAPPAEWSEYPTTALPCRNTPAIEPGTLVLASLAEFGNVDEQAGNDPSGRPITNVLVGQNGKLARYLVGFDRNEFDLIRTNRLYDSLNLPTNPGAPSAATSAPDGTIIVKSAWIELEGLNVDRETFYHRRALLQDPETLVCRDAEVGLVGLHIRYKTPTRPQWLWASFEHVRNVPPAGQARGVSAGGPGYTFNDGSGTPMPGQPPSDTLIHSPHFSAHPAPFNVQRLSPIAPEIEAANAQWQAVLAGTVWANYQLVLVEWPVVGSSPAIDALAAIPDPPSITNQTSNLVNTTMETFLQNQVGPTPNGIRFTCMGCHNNAQLFDYVFTIPINATNAGHMAPSPWRRRMINDLRSLLSEPAGR